MSDFDDFKAMLGQAAIKTEEGHPFLEPGWRAVVFAVGAGLGGSGDGLVTALFKADGSLDSFMFCD